jgi:2,5-diketo-D-gluconate reductase B
MNTLKLPKIGFGTWQLKPDACKTAVLKAIECGYRFIDTAQFYFNEQGVGAALAEKTIDRKELIIATKVWISNLSYKKVKSSFAVSLEKLQLDYADMLYIHWPAKFTYKPKKTLQAFSELVNEGKLKHVCVSNFSPKLVEEAIRVCTKPIAANQVECHPYLQQKEMLDFLTKKDIYLIAYSPLGRGLMEDIPEITQVAQKHHVSPAQVTLAWEITRGIVPIPKSTGEKHIQDNFNAQNLKLDDEDMNLINSIKTQKRMFNPPILAPKW